MFKSALLFASISLLIFGDLNAQDSSVFQPRMVDNSFYVTWGYNRAHYRRSDISLKGDGFDFTIYNVSAHDRPDVFKADVYLNPLKFTIPQFNFRMGYFLNERWSVSAGWDHMKYVIDTPTEVTIDGYIDPALSDKYGRQYSNEQFILPSDLLLYEHTDGLNFARLGIEHHSPVLASNNQQLRLDFVLGASLGLMLPWTDVRFLDKRYEQWVHLAGYGISGQMGLKLKFRNIFFLQYQSQHGFMNMSDVLLLDGEGQAKQKIVFQESSVTLGAHIPIYIKKKVDRKKD